MPWSVAVSRKSIVNKIDNILEFLEIIFYSGEWHKKIDNKRVAGALGKNEDEKRYTECMKILMLIEHLIYTTWFSRHW